MIKSYAKKIYKYFKISTLPYKVTLPYTHVVQVGDPVLRYPAQAVNKSDIETKQIRQVIKIMKTIMVNDGLTSFSACQIGMPLSIIAIHVSQSILNSFTPEYIRQEQLELYPMQVWINPDMKVLDYTSTVKPETCSSLIGLSADVKRHKKILLNGLDENGNTQSLEASNFIARIIQHEMDHLSGIMFTDIMNSRSLKNTLWKEINELNGFVELNYYPKA